MLKLILLLALAAAPGFHLTSIKEGSTYHQVGLKNGDIIQRIDGCAIEKPRDALDAASTIKEPRDHLIDFLRDGRAYVVSWKNGDTKTAKIVEAKDHSGDRPACAKKKI
jgi:hypothetical protein